MGFILGDMRVGMVVDLSTEWRGRVDAGSGLVVFVLYCFGDGPV